MKFFLKFNFARLLNRLSAKKIYNYFNRAMHTVENTDHYNFIFFPNVNWVNLLDYIYKEWFCYEKKHHFMKTIRYD